MYLTLFIFLIMKFYISIINPFILLYLHIPNHHYLSLKVISLQITAGNRHKQNSWFCKEIREDNFRFWWRRVHEDASQGMYMSKI